MRLGWQASFLAVALGLSFAARASGGEGVPPGDDAAPTVTPVSSVAAAPFDSPFGPPPARATIHPHVYTLTECLALSDRNFPNLWAERARLAYAHAQLDEAIWTPWFQWSAQSSFGVSPPLQGTVIYPQSNTGPVTLSSQNISGTNGLEPFLHFGVSGVVPLYTFGKIDTARDAAEANVRVSEWDMEKWRQSMRMDVRRAYYGVELARDAKDVFTDALERLDKGLTGMREKLAKGDPAVSEIDRFRLESYK